MSQVSSYIESEEVRQTTCRLSEGSALFTNPCVYFISRRFVGNSARSSAVFNFVMAASQLLIRPSSSSKGGSGSASFILTMDTGGRESNINSSYHQLTTYIEHTYVIESETDD